MFSINSLYRFLNNPRLYHSFTTYARNPFPSHFEIALPIFRDFSPSLPVRQIAPSRIQVDLSPNIIPFFPIINGRTAVWSRNEEDQSVLVFLNRLFNPQMVDVDRRALAAEKNADSVPYVKTQIGEYKNSLSEEKKKELETQINDSDPALFPLLARVCLEKVLRDSSDELPSFFQELRSRFEQEYRSLTGKSAEELHKKRKSLFDSHATQLIQDIDFIAILQKALEPLPSN